MTPFGSFAAICRMIKIEHSIFALPFAFAGAFIASGGVPAWKPFVLLTIAMVAVRSFAMAFNRVVDLPFDCRNPRTQNRPLVTGEITRLQTWAFIVVMAVVFVLACAGLNRLCLMLSPLALGISALYSVMKRFTWLCHFVLGAVLGLAPLAGWLSVDPVFTLPAVLLFWGVLFWVAGFDILYSCQDTAFDIEVGLHSVPARFGIPTALVISTFCHVNTVVFFLLAGWAAGLSWAWYPVWAIVSLVLVLEHRLIRADDLSRVNMAFFTLNGVVSIVVFAGIVAGVFIGR